MSVVCLRTVFSVFLAILAMGSFAQQAELDSLKNSLKLRQPDTSLINTLNELGFLSLGDDPLQAEKYLTEALDKSVKAKFPKGEANAYVSLAIIASIHSDYKKAHDYYKRAIAIRSRLGDRKGVANIYNNTGNLHDEQGDFFNAVENFKQALEIYQSLGDKTKMGRAQYNISTVYWRMGNYSKAIENVYAYLAIVDKEGDQEGIATANNLLGNLQVDILKPEKAMSFYQTALKIWIDTKNKEEEANILNNIGSLKDDLGETAMKNGKKSEALQLFNESIQYLENSLKIRQARNDEAGISEIYNNLGVVKKNLGTLYLKSNDKILAKKYLNEALQSFKQSLTIREKESDKNGIIEVYNGLGDVYRRLKDYKTAFYYTEAYKKLAEEIGSTKFQQSAFKDLAQLNASIGNYKSAYENRLNYDSLKDVRMDESNLLKYQQDEFNFKEGKRQREIDQKQSQITLQQEKLKTERTRRNSLLGGAILLGLLTLLLYNRYRIKNKSNKELTEKNIIIEQERMRSDQLLMNILPASTALELKTTGAAKAKQYDSVSVLFTDFKNFTQIAEKLNAEELVAELDHCFKGFDAITTKYGIEKIKTIGDAYMCAGGIPDVNQTHPMDTVLAALEMVKFLHDYQLPKIKQGQPYFEVRIGIHTGPVVAGVVGTRKFAYDIWGDTVNLAARMESSGEPGKVNISESTFELVKDHFKCIHRGKIDAKNKGQIDMYFVEDATKV